MMARRTGRTAALALCVLVFAATGCGTSSGDRTEILVSAASSLTDCLQDIKARYEEGRRVTVNLNFGSSGALRRQIEQGAAADLFIPADGKNMEQLIERKLIDESRQTALLSNELVVVAPADSDIRIDSIDQLLREPVRHIAIGDPETVPSGAYAREALERLGIWESVQRVAVYGNTVRQVLAYVETGNADAGFVYRTDAIASDRARTVYTVEPSLHSPILYHVGIIRESEHRDEAEDFYRYLQGSEAREVFLACGFGVIGN